MPMIPVRNLAKGGIQKDTHPTSQPLPGWTNGRNICFQDGKVSRSPIWRRVNANLNAPTDASGTVTGSSASPVRFCIARTPTTGFDEVIIARDDSSLARCVSGLVLGANETGWTSKGATEAPWSGGFLGDVLYVNRPDIVPRVLLPKATQFSTMDSWDPSWRCRVLRTFQDSVVALNVVKAGVDTPSMVKVSDIAFYGQTPGSWDATDPTKLAYESPLAQLRGPILDGLTLGDRFLIYTGHQVIEMRNNGSFLYEFTKLFDDDGAINTNCVVECEGLHFVFGSRDIYATDGQTKKSLAEGRVREWVYRTMNNKLSDRFFAKFFPTTNEIAFCYVSGDGGTAWKTPTGCNNAAIYNRTTDTWSFSDLPNVSAMTEANANSRRTWSQAGSRTWANSGGSWYDLEDTLNKHLLAVSAPLDTRESATVIGGNGLLLGYDFVDRGQLTFPAEEPCNAPSFIERTGIALDFPQEGQAPLVKNKLIRGIYPEVSASRDVTLSVSLGASSTATGSARFGTQTPFNPSTDVAVDYMAEGRFLAIRFDFPPYADTEVSGFDVDVVANGS